MSGLKSEVHNLDTNFHPTFEQKQLVIASESDPCSYEVILAVTNKAQKQILRLKQDPIGVSSGLYLKLLKLIHL